MPRDVPKKTAGGEVNRAEMIRETAKKMGKTVRPRDIAAALKEQGVIVSGSLISKTLKRAGMRKSQGRSAAAAKNSGRKKSAAAAANSAAGQVNKAQRIREVAKSLGKKLRPRDVIAELAKEGIDVTYSLVSKTLRTAGYRRTRRKGATATSGKPATSNGLNLDALIAAKALVNRLGGIDMAQEARAALKKLG